MTIHRVYGHVDRAATEDGKPLRVIMATEGRKADGIDLRMSGANLARYRSNPVLGYGHAYWGRANLPIGRADPKSIEISAGRISTDVIFDADDDFAMKVERKYRREFLNAFSIGFDVDEWESENDNYWRGGVGTAWTLNELSAVPVPMDADAVVTAGRALDSPEMITALQSYSEADWDRVRQRLRQLADATGAQHRFTPAPELIAPGGGPCSRTGASSPPAGDPAGGIDQHAARDLLAALTLKENR